MRLIGLNIDGLNEAQDRNRLLSQAISAKADALFIQEHHLQPSGVRALEGILTRKGWSAIVSCPPSGKGGTAVLLNDSIPIVKVVVDRHTGNSLNGRVCAVDVTLGGKVTRLILLYIPAQSADRGLFLSELIKLNIFNTNTICQAGWNYVADINSDMMHVDSSATPTPYSHARSFESFLKSAGMEDPFRLVHGPNHRDFTRRGNTVWTRLDRFYAPSHNSHFRWLEVEAHPTFYRGHDNASDHLAVTAQIEWATDRKPTKADRRIDPRIFRDERVRNTVSMLWKGVHSRFPTMSYGAAVP